MLDELLQIDALMNLPVLISGCIGIIFGCVAIFYLNKKKIVRCCIQSVFALSFLGLTVLIIMLGANLHTYQRLTKEEEIATIQFWQSGPQQYLAVLSSETQEQEQSFIIYGDEWQIDARIVKWTTATTLAGLDSRYRLERLRGRYRDINQEKFDQRSVFDLTDEPGIAFWPLLIKLQAYLDWIDTYYGNSVYLPMADEAVFQIVLTQSGMITRPENTQARLAITNW